MLSSITSSASVVVTTPSPIPVPLVASYPEGLLVQSLLSAPVVSHHLAFAPLERLTGNAVKERLLLVVVDLLFLVLVEHLTIFRLLDHLLGLVFYHCVSILLSNLGLRSARPVLQLGASQLVQHLLELLIGLLEVVILLELQGLLLQLLWPARLEAAPRVRTP